MVREERAAAGRGISGRVCYICCVAFLKVPTRAGERNPGHGMLPLLSCVPV